MEHWPELKATGAPMTFFLNPSANWQPGYDPTWTAVGAAGNELGNHTWSHCHADLSGCTPVGTQADEIDRATTDIVSKLGVKAVYSFAAPFGDAGWNTYAAPRFLIGRGVMSGPVAASGVSDWYNLPVFQGAAGQTATDFNAGIDSARSQGRWSIFLYHSILPTTNNWFAGVEIADITASLTYAKSLGDVWVDSFIAVGAYHYWSKKCGSAQFSSPGRQWDSADSREIQELLRTVPREGPWRRAVQQPLSFQHVAGF